MTLAAIALVVKIILFDLSLDFFSNVIFEFYCFPGDIEQRVFLGRMLLKSVAHHSCDSS